MTGWSISPFVGHWSRYGFLCQTNELCSILFFGRREW